mmetsp:Transcript_57429/g.86712  ORF Transcript_57429/g.86712 Transcript_57429/m.86712 type:complete len:227 (+) Transcript_57429:407-1087(+)
MPLELLVPNRVRALQLEVGGVDDVVIAVDAVDVHDRVRVARSQHVHVRQLLSLDQFDFKSACHAWWPRRFILYSDALPDFGGQRGLGDMLHHLYDPLLLPDHSRLCGEDGEGALEVLELHHLQHLAVALFHTARHVFAVALHQVMHDVVVRSPEHIEVRLLVPFRGLLRVRVHRMLEGPLERLGWLHRVRERLGDQLGHPQVVDLHPLREQHGSFVGQSLPDLFLD